MDDATLRNIERTNNASAASYSLFTLLVTEWSKAINMRLDAVVHPFEVAPRPVIAASRVIGWRLQVLAGVDGDGDGNE